MHPGADSLRLPSWQDDGGRSVGGFDGKGNSLPAEMLPAQIAFNDVNFQLAPAKTGVANAVVAKGQAVALPPGDYNRVYVLAASSDGDQKATFEAGGHKTQVDVENWGGFVGQWDDRTWSSNDTVHDNYGEMTGLTPGFIKRADLAWYSSHHHDAAGKNVSYGYSYLFAYGIDLPVGAKTLRLPKNDKIRILAVSVAHEEATTAPAQPLYDVLPSPTAGAPDFTVTAPREISVPQDKVATSRILVMPRGSFKGSVKLVASGLPAGATASFNPAVTSGSSVMTLTTTRTTTAGTGVITISASGDGTSHSATAKLSITPVLSGTVPVNLTSAYNVTGIYKDGAKFSTDQSLDAGGYSFSAQAIGTEQIGAGVVFMLGAAGVPDVVTSKTVDLPAGKFSSLKVLATATEGNQPLQIFTVNYSDGSSSSFTQSLSDWSGTASLQGESLAVKMPYRLGGDGSTDGNPFNANAYSFDLDPTKQVRSISLPSNRNVLVLAMTLVPAAQH